MSIPKNIRNRYEKTFNSLVNTSAASKKIILFLKKVTQPSPLINLPIKLSEVKMDLWAMATKPGKKKTTRKASAAKKTTVRKPRKAKSKD